MAITSMITTSRSCRAGRGTDPLHRQQTGLQVASDGYMDAHELSHANDIRKRFTNRDVTTWQIMLFGLTGGLIPCPAAITVLLLCVQLKEFTLGAVLVLCFSIGLAITLVTVGAIAAISVRQATKRVSWLSTVAARAPYFSSALIVLVGLYTGYHGWTGLMAQHHAPAAIMRHQPRPIRADRRKRRRAQCPPCVCAAMMVICDRDRAEGGLRRRSGWLLYVSGGPRDGSEPARHHRSAGSAGGCVRQIASTCGQRPWKRQPGGGLSGLGGSPPSAAAP